MRFHERLFRYNLGAEAPARHLLRREARWVRREFARGKPGHPPASFAEFLRRLDGAVRAVARPGAEAEFLAGGVSLGQFRGVVAEYAPDGLTEASAMCHALPRLPARAQMPLARILIDEYGCGNLGRAHSQLYRRLLEELGMDTRLEAYLGTATTASLAAVNIWHWMARRAPAVELYLGALAYVEAAIPAAFRPFAAACARLGVAQHGYFTEHIHIDTYHANDARRILAALGRARPVEHGQAWAGVTLARRLARRAFRTAMARSREGQG
jgi:pyrroloquinoline quinone (PQQ) biosynthesis protein C